MPIMLRAFIPPAILLVCIFAILLRMDVLVTRTNTGLQELKSVDLPFRAALEKLVEQISDAQIRLLRHVSWLNSGVDEKLLGKSESELREANLEIERAIREIQKNRGFPQEQTANLLQISEKSQRYAELVNEAAEMGRIQPSMAVMMVGEADQIISEVRESIGAMLVLAANKSEDRVQSLRSAAIEDQRVLTIAVAMALLIVVPLIVLLTLSVSRPIVRITRWMSEISRGNHAAEFRMTPRRDEIGRMIEAIGIFQTHSQRLLELERARELENTNRAKQGRLEMAKLADTVDEMVKLSADRLQEAASRMSGRSSELLTTAKATRGEVEAVAQAVKQASQSVQTVAAASEEMAATINELSQQVGEIGQTVSGTSKGSGVARQDLAGLTDAVTQISSVLELIQAIASRTNLLALNATIESARAGEAGKGFAVVAAEVKGLAAQTGLATAEITKSIEDVRVKCCRLTASLDGMIGSMASVQEMTESMMQAIEQQSLATREIAAGAVQASESVSSVAGKVTHLLGAANDTAETSDVVRSETEAVRRESENVNRSVDLFVRQIRQRA